MKIFNSPDGHLFVQHGDGSWSFVCFEGSDDTDWIRRTFEPPEPMDELVEWRATAATYPDPTGVPPQGRPSATALWLLARHPKLAELAMRIPGAIDPDGDLDLDRLAGAVRELDANLLAWGEFRRTHGEPPAHADDATYEAWRATGPQRTAGADALADMSDTERALVRFLAFWSGLRVGLGSADLLGLDAEGQQMVADWCTAVQAS